MTTVETYQLADGKPLASFAIHEKADRVAALAFSADGELAAMGGTDGSVRLWSVSKRERIGGDFPAHTESIVDLCVTPDKKFVVTADSKGEVKIWDVANTKEPVHTIMAHKEKVACFAMSPDSKRFATAGQDNVIKLWDVQRARKSRCGIYISRRRRAATPANRNGRSSAISRSRPTASN